MTVTVKFIYKDLAEGLVSGEYTVPSGATIRDVFAACALECNAALPEDYEKMVQFLLNGKSAQWDEVVPEGSTLHVLHAILGG
jgi:hypothetical protein